MGLRNFLNLPLFVLASFVVAMLFGDMVNCTTKAQLYAISLCLKNLIVLVLPIIIFSLVMSGIMNLKDKSFKAIFVLLALVCLSNFAGFCVAYAITVPTLKSGVIAISRLNQVDSLSPSWQLQIGRLISNEVALFSGLVFGIIGNFIKNDLFEKFSQKLLAITNFILKRVIAAILPLFILGFVMKMQHDKSLILIIKEYSRLLFMVVLLAYGYMLIILYLVSERNIVSVFSKFKNLLPGILIGFFGMSSAAAIPTTIECCKKNMKNGKEASFVVPTTANMHLLGDCFAIPIIGLALMTSFGHELPSVQSYLTFALYGVVAKFAAAGIPGGSIIIFAPILENIFGFSGEMLAAITTIYMLFDPFATSANVFGHGVFAMVFEKVYDGLFNPRVQH
jgi:Na+/H+-dicarboxylate symporter